MKNYKEVESYFINKINNSSFDKIMAICHFMIAKIVENISNDFVDNALEEEQPLLINLHQSLSKSSPIKQELIQIIDELDNIVEQYGDDYPADMDFYPLSLITVANCYCQICTMIEKDIIDNNINENAISILLTYLDFLDFEQSETDGVDTKIWATYPKIKNGIQALNDLFEN